MTRKKHRRWRAELVLAQAGRCAVCGQPFGTGLRFRPTLDHIVPRGEGGADVLANCRAVHSRCNARLNKQVMARYKGIGQPARRAVRLLPAAAADA